MGMTVIIWCEYIIKRPHLCVYENLYNDTLCCLCRANDEAATRRRSQDVPENHRCILRTSDGRP